MATEHQAPAPRGRLKIFLGYSSGVGKSYRMLDEGRRRGERGQDVVVGAVQPRTESAAAELLRHLPAVPMRTFHGQAVMDVEALLQRHPEVCLVDGMAYDYPPGAPYAHRWQEIEALLAAGISVIATVNLQFIAERQAEVEAITGRRAPQAIPLALLLSSDEIEVVDAPPNPTAPAAQRAQLSALREIALVLAADVVDRQLASYLQTHGIEARWGTQERILVCLTPTRAARAMIASGQRNAERFRGELLAVHVRQFWLRRRQREELQTQLRQARQAGAEVAILEAGDFVKSVLDFARSRGVTQLFVGHSVRRHWWQRLSPSSLDRLIRAATDIDVRVFPH
ncbi:MAG TPA: hypothetical protein VN515_00375 [Terriglobales bacterium]|nr:hypothetical protein [Terriglobales bacterium]